MFTSTSEIPTLFIYLKPDKDFPFGRSLLAEAIMGSSPSGRNESFRPCIRRSLSPTQPTAPGSPSQQSLSSASSKLAYYFFLLKKTKGAFAGRVPLGLFGWVRFSTPYSWRVSKRVRNYTVCMRIQCRIISVGGCSEKNMNCKLKPHSKGFYLQILGAVAALKFLQTLALDFPYICLQFFPGNF